MDRNISQLGFKDAIAREPKEGRLSLYLYRGETLVDEIHEQNLLMAAARPRIRLLNSVGGENLHITHIGVGTGSAPAAVEDAGLTNQYLVPVQNVANPDAWTARFNFLIGPTDANGLAIREFGLFCGDGLLFAKRVRDRIIEKDRELVLFGFWDVHF